MSDPFDNAVTQTRRRLNTARHSRSIAIAVIGGCATTIVALPITRDPAALLFAAAIGALAAAWAWRSERVTDADAALWLDRRLGLRDLLPSVLAADGQVADHLRQQANQRLLEPLPRPAWPTTAAAVAVVAILLVGSAGLLIDDEPAASTSVADAATADEPETLVSTTEPTSTDTPTKVGEADPTDTNTTRGGETDTLGQSPAAGSATATTDTLNVTTPRRNDAPTNGNNAPGTGNTATGNGTSSANGTTNANPPTKPTTDTNRIDGDTNAPSLPPRVHDLIDAYYQ